MSWGLEDVDEPLVLGGRFLESLELVAARSERAGRGMTKGRYRLLRLLAGIDELLRKRTDDAVPAGIDLAEYLRMAASGLDDTRRRRVDDRGHPAGLGIEDVAGAHG